MSRNDWNPVIRRSGTTAWLRHERSLLREEQKTVECLLALDQTYVLFLSVAARFLALARPLPESFLSNS
jgi:hypothetical protein